MRTVNINIFTTFLVYITALLPILTIYGLILSVQYCLQFTWPFFFDDLGEIINFQWPEVAKGWILVLLFVANMLIYGALLKFSYYSVLSAIKWLFRRNTAKKRLISYYFSLLKRYVSKRDIKLIFKSHWVFWKHILSSKFHVKNKDLAWFYSPLELRNQIQSFNNLCVHHIWEENYIKNVEVEKSYFICHIHKWKLSSEELVKNIERKRDEIIRFFRRRDYEANMKVEKKGLYTVSVEIYNEDLLWQNQKLDLEDVYLKKWEWLCGFSPSIQSGVSYKDYFLKSYEIFHCYIVWSTRSWKDHFMRNIFYSCLYHIKKYNNTTLHFFDVKWNDGIFLDHLKSHWVYRYTDLASYSEIFKSFVSDMRKKQEKIWAYANIYEYNRENEESPLREDVIVMNEFLSLSSRVTWRELDELLGYLVSLTSEWAWAWYKIIIMSQTARKDVNSKISEILVNIKTKFALRVNNLEEGYIISRGLSENDRSRMTSLKQYNCLHIEDGSIKKEFKAYDFSKKDLMEWVDNNFKRSKEFSNKNINDYLKYSQKNNEISFKTASEDFELSRTDWNKFIKYVEEKNLIERLSNNKIIWKKSMKYSVDII